MLLNYFPYRAGAWGGVDGDNRSWERLETDGALGRTGAHGLESMASNSFRGRPRWWRIHSFHDEIAMCFDFLFQFGGSRYFWHFKANARLSNYNLKMTNYSFCQFFLKKGKIKISNIIPISKQEHSCLRIFETFETPDLKSPEMHREGRVSFWGRVGHVGDRLWAHRHLLSRR